jgi:mannose-1-phosphate guanylyltransferase
MVEQTFRRVERLIPAHQILTVVTRQHLLHPDVCRQLARRRSETIVVQPSNKETGPGILLPLAFICNRSPEAIVALFPSDHFILQEERFMNYVTLAIQAVKHDDSQIILLAIEPHKPEPEYGYIVPGEDSGNVYRFGTRPVSGFIEKPRPERAVELLTAGALWNTMTMVFKLETLWELVRKVQPALYANFYRILQAIGTPDEQRTVNAVYERLRPVNFSKEIVEKIAERQAKSIAVLPVRDVFWSDLGSPERVLQAVRKLDQHGVENVHAYNEFIQPASPRFHSARLSTGL